MQQFPDGLGALLIESGASSLRTRRASLKSTQATLIEGVDSVAHLLTGAASQRAGYCRGAFAPVAGEDDLGSAHEESVLGERRALSKCSFCVSESERTKMGDLMVSTIASYTTPILDVH